MSDSTLYAPDGLAWFASEYGNTEWLVHATGPDDIYLNEGDADLEDNPDARPLSREGAINLASEINFIGARLEAEFGPDKEGLRPRFVATVFHRGEPYTEQMFPAAYALRWAARVIRKNPEYKHLWEMATADLWEHTADEWNVELDCPECPNGGEGCGGHGAEWGCVSCCGTPVGECACIHGLAYKGASAFLADAGAPTAAVAKPAPTVCGFELDDGSVAHYGVGGAE